MNHIEVEKKWQKIWEEEKRFEVPNTVEGKENRYILIEFPYPSGKGRGDAKRHFITVEKRE